jgi:DNA mismatch endonuclease, patch repair protein
LQKVVFVHGCFWHRHTCKDGQKLPKGNVGYWGPKLARNAARDTKQEAQLLELGWDVLTIWECGSESSIASRSDYSAFS